MKATMLRRILVPVDFSPESLKPLAKIFGANLHLVIVVNPPPIFPSRRATLAFAFSETEVGRGEKQRLKSLAAEFSLPPRANTCARDEMEKLRRAVSRKSVAIENEIAVSNRPPAKKARRGK